jgi:hypothetical protein
MKNERAIRGKLLRRACSERHVLPVILSAAKNLFSPAFLSAVLSAAKDLAAEGGTKKRTRASQKVPSPRLLGTTNFSLPSLVSFRSPG